MKNQKGVSLIMLIACIGIIILIILFLKSSFNNSSKNLLTLEQINNKFEEKGIEINLEQKPYYSMIGAIDGEMFYIDNQVVKLYVYESEKTYNEALENYSTIIKNMPKKDLIIIETSSEKALEIFNSL